MRRAEGHYHIVDPDLPRGGLEIDTIQCTHCGGHFAMTPRVDPTCAHGYCGRCHHFICQRCADRMDRTGRCQPWEREMAARESRDRLRRAVEEWG